MRGVSLWQRRNFSSAQMMRYEQNTDFIKTRFFDFFKIWFYDEKSIPRYEKQVPGPARTLPDPENFEQKSAIIFFGVPVEPPMKTKLMSCHWFRKCLWIWTDGHVETATVFQGLPRMLLFFFLRIYRVECGEVHCDNGVILARRKWWDMSNIQIL